MMVMLMAVVRALKSRASTAAGEVISCHAELLTVQITRLKIGRAMNPASSESAPTARPPDRYPPPKSLLLLLLLLLLPLVLLLYLIVILIHLMKMIVVIMKRRISLTHHKIA
jgi:hypothetical protein